MSSVLGFALTCVRALVYLPSMDAKKGISEAARAMARLGAAEGGRARAAKLTAEERSLAARQAAAARWGKPLPDPLVADGPALPVATYGSPDRPLRIGSIEIPCYVLDDGRRVLSQVGLQLGIGFSRSGGKSGSRRLPYFLASLEAKGLDLKGLTARASEPLVFVPSHGGRTALGYEATILPEVCEAVLEARRHKLLNPQQARLAQQCEILLGGLARVGIIALVDEATGYQDQRARDALAKILEAFVAKELRPWVRTFEPEFYKEMFRLRGIPYSGSPKKPAYIGHLTNDIVYDRLAPGVLEKLREVNPSHGGRRKYRHFQWLTENQGYPALREHLAVATALMKISKDWNSFHRRLDMVKPRQNESLAFAFAEPDHVPED